MDNILVTGGAGYVGSHACKALARAGYRPIVYDNFVTGHEWAVRWGPLLKGDILDRSQLDAAFEQFQPRAVMHFAACAYVDESVKQPAKYYRNNVAGTLTLLASMRDHGVDRLVFSSSCTTYGNPTTLPILEDHPQAPISPYGASKLIVERVLADYADAYGLRSCSLRYFNAAGADPDGEIGEDHDPETHLIPIILETAAGLREHVTIYGTDYDTQDGTCIRDFVHVSDLADAHAQALDALERHQGSARLNLGNGMGFSVREVVETARRVTGLPIAVKEHARRPGDVPALVADATRARRELGWHPLHADLDEIIATAWRWLLTHRHVQTPRASPVDQATLDS
jgi:UDP-arabinose 4-epimerase